MIEYTITKIGVDHYYGKVRTGPKSFFLIKTSFQVIRYKFMMR